MYENIKEYVVIQGSSVQIDSLVGEINRRLNDGWELVGGIDGVVSFGEVILYSQAMTRAVAKKKGSTE